MCVCTRMHRILVYITVTLPLSLFQIQDPGSAPGPLTYWGLIQPVNSPGQRIGLIWAPFGMVHGAIH